MHFGFAWAYTRCKNSTMASSEGGKESIVSSLKIIVRFSSLVATMTQFESGKMKMMSGFVRTLLQVGQQER
jgi:hypothetical protein